MIITYVATACLLVSSADAQAPPANAALRYWMAFAVMRDPPADKATADLLEQVSEGRAAWDEEKLGRIVDDNREALDIMRRASVLTVCDWGLEYELGPRTPISHLAKARALGRLSVVAGKRLQAQGQLSQAVDMWLAGVRFSQHIAQGGSLISALSGGRVMAPSLRAIHREPVLRSLDADTKKRIEAVLRAMPETGFDLAAAMRRDTASLDVTLSELQAAADQKAYLARIGAPADMTAPSPAEIAAFHAFMERIEEALALPLIIQRGSKLAEVEAGRQALHPFFRRFSPSSMPLGTSALWIEIAGRRQSLLDAVTRP
jgi:hypothetical protein